MSRPVRNKRLYGRPGPGIENPSHPGKGSDKVSRKISHLVREEGKDQDEAVAQALSMDERGDL